VFIEQQPTTLALGQALPTVPCVEVQMVSTVLWSALGTLP
jgi:hypothetical protein